jgi:hypothetical protein
LTRARTGTLQRPIHSDMRALVSPGVGESRHDEAARRRGTVMVCRSRTATALRWRPVLQHRPVRSPEHRTAVQHLEREATGPVHHPVVSAAHQEDVRCRRLTPIRQVKYVVRVAPGLGTITSREPAVAVTDDHGPSHRRWDDRGAPAHVEWLGASGHHDPHHRGIAGDPSRGTGRDRACVIELRRAFLTREILDSDGHAQVRSFSTDVRPSPATDGRSLPGRRPDAARESGDRPDHVSVPRSRARLPRP